MKKAIVVSLAFKPHNNISKVYEIYMSTIL